MRIGFFQYCPEHKNPEANLTKVCKALSGVQADLMVLPELCLTGYSFSSRAELTRFSQPVPDGEFCQVFLSLCRERRINLVFGMAEKAGNRIYNSAVLITTGGAVHSYRKAHLFWDEKELFDPGDSPFPVFTLGDVRIGMLVCFDHIYPEAARSLALQGAQIISHPSNLILEIAQLTTTVRAIENRVYWILANRTGEEQQGSRRLTFTGQSQIVAPDGRLLCRAGPDSEEVVILEIDPAAALNKFVTPKNDLFADRRPELYFGQ
ncbi:MAG: nitrilase-related carbon-nitrogen hydrolase [candidate division WOR-3 bacterium]